MQSVKIELTLDLVNAVLQYLETKPASEVYGLIYAIRAQGQPQVPQQEAEPEAPAVEAPTAE